MTQASGSRNTSSTQVRCMFMTLLDTAQGMQGRQLLGLACTQAYFAARPARAAVSELLSMKQHAAQVDQSWGCKACL